MNPEMEKLTKRLGELEQQVYQTVRPDRYVFQRNVQLVNPAHFIGGIYGAYVDASGNAIVLPPGWTCVQNVTGRYTVTHNLGTTRYVAVVTCNTMSTFWETMVGNVRDQTSTYIHVSTVESGGGSLQSSAFFVIILML